MNTLSIKEHFEQRIKQLLLDDKFKDITIVKRGFESPKEITMGGLLFVGLNPSYVDNTPSEKVNFYELKPSDNDYKQYFGKFEEVSNRTNMPWAHIDLLFLRETKQNLIDQIMREPNGVDFIYQQLMISKDILEKAHPRVIVVSNTKARLFMGFEKKDGVKVWMDYDFEFDEAIGTHRITTEGSTLKGVPVFFTSMLTGQRAIDNGSFERLVWHIKFALTKSGN